LRALNITDHDAWCRKEKPEPIKIMFIRVVYDFSFNLMFNTTFTGIDLKNKAI
jgi:hypothetical protein